jgi:DNA-binding CsgD family transcriptional regulator
MTQPLALDFSKRIPCWLRAAAERVIAASDHPAHLQRVFASSSVPLVMVDGERRYVDANPAARLAFRQTLAALRRLRIDDLTPHYFLPVMQQAWTRLIETGCVAGLSDVGSPTGTHWHVTYYARAETLPGLHLIAFAPADWPAEELLVDLRLPDSGTWPSLTPRELEVLGLAAEGGTASEIAQKLGVHATTVKTHFDNIYAKLGVRDRAAAVAKAMRLALIK